LLSGGSSERSEPDVEIVRHYLRSLITHKLWSADELTCFEPRASPVRGSAIACEQPACRAGHPTSSLSGQCCSETWIKTLKRYPGLERHVTSTPG
jgi:hypothetical protein